MYIHVYVCLSSLHPLSFPLPLQTLTVTIQSSKDQRRDSASDDTKSDKVESVSFPCSQLGRLQTWHHVIVTVSKTLRQKAKVSLYVDGLSLGIQKVLYMYFIMGIYTSTYLHVYMYIEFFSHRSTLNVSWLVFQSKTAKPLFQY